MTSECNFADHDGPCIQAPVDGTEYCPAHTRPVTVCRTCGDPVEYQPHGGGWVHTDGTVWCQVSDTTPRGVSLTAATPVDDPAAPVDLIAEIQNYRRP